MAWACPQNGQGRYIPCKPKTALRWTQPGKSPGKRKQSRPRTTWGGTVLTVVFPQFTSFHSVLTELKEMGLTLGSLSNYDGTTNENVTQKTNFTFLKLLRYFPN